MISTRRKDGEISDLNPEAGVRGASQKPIDLFQLAALPLPAHPKAFLRIPLSLAVEEEELVLPSVAVLRVEPGDACLRGLENPVIVGHFFGGRIDEVAEDGEMEGGVHVPQRLHLQVLQKSNHPFDALEKRGNDDHRARTGGDPARKIDPRQPSRRDEPCPQLLDEEDGRLARRQEIQEHQPTRHSSSQIWTRVSQGQSDPQRGEDSDASQIGDRGVREGESAQSLVQGGLPGHVGFEVFPAAPDQVVAHVTGQLGPRGRLGVPCARHRPQRHPDLSLAGRVGQLLDGLPIAVAAGEVHPAVNPRGVALEDLLNQAHALEVETPVVRRAESQAGDRICHRGLQGCLALVLGPDRILDGHPLDRQLLVEPGAKRDCLRAVVADSLEQMNDQSGVEDAGKRRAGNFPPV